MRELTKAEGQMLHLCINRAAAWVTAPGSPAEVLLKDWQGKGWAEPTVAPADFLVAYRFTDAGRIALRAKEQETRG